MSSRRAICGPVWSASGTCSGARRIDDPYEVMRKDRKYRIAMVAACPFPSLRGSQALVRELAEALAGNGHEVHVVTYPAAQHIAPVERISIHRVPRVPLVSPTPKAVGWQKIVLDILLVWTLWRVVRNHDIDVIHAHNVEAPIVGYLVRLLTGIPVVYHAHNALVDELPFYVRSGLGKRIARGLGRAADARLAAWSDHAVALSPRLGAYMAVRGAAAKLSVIPPAVSHAQAGLPGGLGRSPGGLHGGRLGAGPRIVYAGNLDGYQNLTCLLEAFARICAGEPRARLVMVLHAAAGAARVQEIRRLSKIPGVSVRLAGTHGAAARELRRADVLVCPRTSWSGFPIKILNYMAAGRPIVQARASAHVIEDGISGLLYDDDEPGSLAKTVLKVVRDAELGERLSLAARQRLATDFSSAVVIPKIEEVYRKIVDDEDFTSKRKNETLSCGDDRMTAMPKNHTRPLAVPEQSRRWQAVSQLAGFLAVLTAFGCAPRAPEPAPLPPIAAPALPGSLHEVANYRISAGDQLRVKFLYHPELDVKVPVAPDGNMNIPSVGEISAEGKTAEEVAAEVEKVSSELLRDPEVTVIVAEFGERIVYVGGEVRLPGPVRYREGMTPLQAILDRGGFTEVARTDSVLHLSPNGSSYDARRLDYTTDVNQFDPEQASLGVYDVVYVPRTFIGDANAFVRLYIRGLMPTMPRVGIGFSP